MAFGQRKTVYLHGNAPDTSPVALLLIHVVNDLDFPGNANLLRKAPTLGKRIAGNTDVVAQEFALYTSMTIVATGVPTFEL